jgi:hypothetical protein
MVALMVVISMVFSATAPQVVIEREGICQ